MVGGPKKILLPIDRAIAERWGRLGIPDPLPIIDGLLVATALEHVFTLVTREVLGSSRGGVRYLDPFESSGARSDRAKYYGPRAPIGDDGHTIRSTAAVSPGGDDCQDRRFTVPGVVDAVAQPQQLRSRRLDLRSPELDLERSPSPIAQLDDGVCLQAVAVVVVEDLRVVDLGVDAKATDHERLEERPHGVDLTGESVGSGPEGCHRQRRVHEVPRRCDTQSAP